MQASVTPSLGARNKNKIHCHVHELMCRFPRGVLDPSIDLEVGDLTGSVQNRGARQPSTESSKSLREETSVQMIKAMQGEIEAIKKKTVCLKQACLKKNRASLALNNLLYYMNPQALTLLRASTWRNKSIFIANKGNIDHSDVEISDPKVLISIFNSY